MTLLNAPAYDPRRARRKKELLAAGLLSLVLVGLLTYHFWYWHEERTVDKFFSHLEQKDYEGAYGIWMADPGWNPNLYWFIQPISVPGGSGTIRRLWGDANPSRSWLLAVCNCLCCYDRSFLYTRPQ